MSRHLTLSPRRAARETLRTQEGGTTALECHTRYCNILIYNISFIRIWWDGSRSHIRSGHPHSAVSFPISARKSSSAPPQTATAHSSSMPLVFGNHRSYCPGKTATPLASFQAFRTCAGSGQSIGRNPRDHADTSASICEGWLDAFQ